MARHIDMIYDCLIQGVPEVMCWCPRSNMCLILLCSSVHTVKCSGMKMINVNYHDPIHPKPIFYLKRIQLKFSWTLKFSRARNFLTINLSDIQQDNHILINIQNGTSKMPIYAVVLSMESETSIVRLEVLAFFKIWVAYYCINGRKRRSIICYNFYYTFFRILDHNEPDQMTCTVVKIHFQKCDFLNSDCSPFCNAWKSINILTSPARYVTKASGLVEGKKSYKCPLCEQRLTQKDAIMQNQRINIKEKTYEYSHCGLFLQISYKINFKRSCAIPTMMYMLQLYGSSVKVHLSGLSVSHIVGIYMTFPLYVLSYVASDYTSEHNLSHWMHLLPHIFLHRVFDSLQYRFSLNHKSYMLMLGGPALMLPTAIAKRSGATREADHREPSLSKLVKQSHRPGIEYSLTYFDNPGTRLPQSVSNFIATTGFPNFLKKNHDAALTLQSRYENGDDVYISLPCNLRYPHAEEQLPLVDQEQETQTLQNVLENVIEIDIKPSEEQFPIIDHEQMTFGLQNIVIGSKNEILDSNKTVPSAQIDYQEPNIQNQIDEKSDIIQKDASHALIKDKVEELLIKSHIELTKEAVSVRSKKEINLIPAEVLVQDEEPFVKEHVFANEMKVMKEDLKEKNKPLKYTEDQNLSKKFIETPKISIAQERVSEDIVENFIEPDASKLCMKSKDSENKNEYRNAIDNLDNNFDKYSQKENDTTVQINKNESLLDMKIEVPIGSKKVVVDLLEAMEVISPELEQKTVLLKKVEDWAEAALKDIDESSEFIQGVNMLCSKIEKFKKRAKNKKIESLRLMEEMEKQANNEKEFKTRIGFGHYDHSGGLDEKTLLTLEKFLMTMKEVVERDKDMRTGRGYNIDSCEILDNSKQNIFREKMSHEINTEPVLKDLGEEQHQEIKQKKSEICIKKEDIVIEKNGKNETILDNRVRLIDLNIDDGSKDVKNETDTENKKEDPPKDPPEPTGTKPKGIREIAKVDNLPTVDTAQINNNVKSDDASKSENKDIVSSTDSWIHSYFPVMSFFGGGNNKVVDEGLVLSQGDKIEEKPIHNVNTQGSSWYTFGLEGYFKKTSSAQESDSSVSRRETENTNGCEIVDSNGTSWYWYPIIGMHKLYIWAWNSGVKV
ncbi:unnamed protein product, partial [Meganyctiphanes norvegica]